MVLITSMNNANTNNICENLNVDDIQKLSILHSFKPLLAKLHSHADCFNRILHYDQYISLLLLYFFNPTFTGLRSLQQASTLEKVQKKLDIKRTSLGSLSEASNVFDPQLLIPIIAELAQEANPLKLDGRLNKLDMKLIAVDGTLLKALPKMLWALWIDDEHRAAKMHLEFDIIKGLPVNAQLTDANASEIAALEAALSSGKLYCLDGGYVKYSFLNKIIENLSSFVTHLKDTACYEIIQELPLSEADCQAGIEFDRTVWLGSKQKRKELSKPIRVIQFHYNDKRSLSGNRNKSITTNKKTLLIATDIMDLPAELIILIYRYRWQIELFFRWFKHILGCQHLLSHSQNGITIQVYCALIASLLIRLWTDRKPTKRTFEMICLYFQGWATLDELIKHIQGLKSANKKS